MNLPNVNSHRKVVFPGGTGLGGLYVTVTGIRALYSLAEKKKLIYV